MKNKALKIITLFLLFAVCSQAAPTFEIKTMDKGDGEIGVFMRETSGEPPTTTDLYLDLTFGIKWSTAYGIDLLATTSTSYNIAKSGVRETEGAFHYQAFGLDPFAPGINYFPTTWTVDVWVEILSIKNEQTGSGCGTFEIAEDGFKESINPNINVNLSDFSPIITGAAACVSLPISLTRFTAKARDTEVLLNWTTETEENSARFQIEHRTNKKNWTTLGEVAAATESIAQKKYAYIDKNPYIGDNYYRLMMVDQDETFEYSEVRVVKFTDRESKIAVFPNPIHPDQQLNVLFSKKPASKPIISLLDIRGREHLLMIDVSSDGRQHELVLPDLATGCYFLKIITDEQVFSEKVLINSIY